VRIVRLCARPDNSLFARRASPWVFKSHYVLLSSLSQTLKGIECRPVVAGSRAFGSR
jgi:hypothetical protein